MVPAATVRLATGVVKPGIDELQDLFDEP